MTLATRVPGFKSLVTNDVWLTPLSVLIGLGPFDLDPCAAPEPRPWTTAARMISLPDDGLEEEWTGRVWLNPPFSKARAFVAKMAEHRNGVALIPARTETDWWWDHVWKPASGMLFIRGRVEFLYPDGLRARAAFPGPMVLVAYGEANVAAIAKAGVRGALVRGPFVS